MSKLPDTRQSSGIGAQRRLATVKEMIKTIKPGDEIISGLRAFDTAGHTPGHLSYEIASKSDRLMIIGDALLHPVVSFQHPAWRGDVDTDPDQAVRTRKKLLDKLAQDKTPIIGYHLPTPGLGAVERKGAAYAFVQA